VLQIHAVAEAITERLFGLGAVFKALPLDSPVGDDQSATPERWPRVVSERWRW
jgi:hypothetical protein